MEIRGSLQLCALPAPKDDTDKNPVCLPQEATVPYDILQAHLAAPKKPVGNVPLAWLAWPRGLPAAPPTRR